MDLVDLWRPTGRAELDLVAASQWRAWPPRLPDQPIFYPVANRWYATKIAREWNVPTEGVGFVTRFSVRRDFLARYPVQQAGGREVLEHWVPAEDLDEFNANIVGAIVREAEYRGPVADEEFDQAAAHGCPLPAGWRRYLQGESWFRSGWLGDTFLTLYTPSETLEANAAWGEPTAAHPGIAIIGDDGSRERLAFDLRHDPAPVSLVDVTSTNWSAALPLASDAAAFTARVESGDITW
ncbi:SMI1/KNR4 family protein [Saccharothrix sp. ALI-22-I]|uniref:SMI1/KNR4 family protein n=1 Tax=Saccharothrix sp. ALI-22-I TaxID=1933778 RepID=UPI0019310BAB|nr:SMI1/KNR4 family protein [Saccharothrix sp. ALI-22-I]